jgi:predicted transcriptional regulator
MKKSKIEVRSESTESFFDRLRDHARKLDRSEVLAATVTISFEDPVEMSRVLSSERVRLLRCVKAKSQQISVLASGLKRDVRAVSRDVSLLEKAGLVRTTYRSNPGHGRLKVVEPVAQNYRLVASL